MKSFTIAMIFLTPFFFATIHPSYQPTQRPEESDYRKMHPIQPYCAKVPLFKKNFKTKSAAPLKSITPHHSEIKNPKMQTKVLSIPEQQKKLIVEQSLIQKNLKDIKAAVMVLNSLKTSNILNTYTSNMNTTEINSLIYELRLRKPTKTLTFTVNCAGNAIAQAKDLTLAKAFISRLGNSTFTLDQAVKENLAQFLQSKTDELSAKLDSKKTSVVAAKTANITQPAVLSERGEKNNDDEAEESKSNDENNTFRDAWDND